MGPVPLHTPLTFIFSPPFGFRLARRRAHLLRFHVINAIIAYLPSGDKKVIIPSAHRYFIIFPSLPLFPPSPPRPSFLRSSEACSESGHSLSVAPAIRSELLFNDGRGGNYAIIRGNKIPTKSQTGRWSCDIRKFKSTL